MHESPRIVPAGDRALVIEVGDAISPEVNRRVHDIASAVEKADLSAISELVPTYRSLLLYYDPLVASMSEMEDAIGAAIDSAIESDPVPQRVVHVPTLYGGEYGPDIEFVAEHSGLSIDDVIARHSGTDYLVYMMGFAPGFPYLGGLAEELTTPRLDTPRTEIPAGSVGIAENQTGIYPLASPGGWQLIGRTPLKLFDAHSDHPSLLGAGDYVRFVPVNSEKEYLDIQSGIASGDFEVVTEVAQ